MQNFYICIDPNVAELSVLQIYSCRVKINVFHSKNSGSAGSSLKQDKGHFLNEL